MVVHGDDVDVIIMCDVVDDHGGDERGCDVAMCWFDVGFSGEREDLFDSRTRHFEKGEAVCHECAISFGIMLGTIFLIGLISRKPARC